MDGRVLSHAWYYWYIYIYATYMRILRPILVRELLFSEVSKSVWKYLEICVRYVDISSQFLWNSYETKQSGK